ncbi:hypothetical protein FKM82_008704 [Ascaphus truei]
METAVNKLEAMFQKAESDLDYIEQKLKFELRKNLHEDSSEQLNTIAAEQQESVASIQTTLGSAMKMVQHLQQQTDFQVKTFTCTFIVNVVFFQMTTFRA